MCFAGFVLTLVICTSVQYVVLTVWIENNKPKTWNCFKNNRQWMKCVYKLTTLKTVFMWTVFFRVKAQV